LTKALSLLISLFTANIVGARTTVGAGETCPKTCKRIPSASRDRQSLSENFTGGFHPPLQLLTLSKRVADFISGKILP